MSRISWFDSELLDKSWFEPELTPEAWFDSELIDTGVAGTTQTLSITLDGISASITQSLRHSQSISFALDSIAPNITQVRQKTQSITFTLDSVGVGITQYGRKSQSLSVVLDSISATINQTKTAANKTQSINFLLDGVNVSFEQLNGSTPEPPSITAGSVFPRKKPLPVFWSPSTEWQDPAIYYAKKAKQEDEFFMLAMH